MSTFQTVMFLVSLLVLMINSSILSNNYLQTEVFIALKWHLIQHFQRQWITSISIYLKWLWRPRWRCPWLWHIIRPCRLGFTGLFLFLSFFWTWRVFCLVSRLSEWMRPRRALSISSLCSALCSNPAMTGVINLESTHTVPHNRNSQQSVKSRHCWWGL